MEKCGPSASAEYLQYNMLGKIPTFVGADGYVLSETIAIAIYRKLPIALTLSIQPGSVQLPGRPGSAYGDPAFDAGQSHCLHDENYHNSYP